MATTLGVEEEFLLVGVADSCPAPLAPAVLARIGTDTGLEIKPELLTDQLELATPVCDDLAGLAAHLHAGRSALADAAREEGALLLSTGTPVLSTERTSIAAGPRYEAIIAQYADIAGDYEVCGCHVHVGVQDADVRVAVVNHLRPWLPTLLALSVNSPFHRGRDTGYASWRAVKQARFPGSGVPPYFPTSRDYESELDTLVTCGVLADHRMTFWMARPSPRFPTVEIRAADAAATVGEALLQAALCRALVTTALTDIAHGAAAPAVRGQIAAAAVWSAARYGLDGPAVHPLEEVRVPAWGLVDALVRHVRPALVETGDLDYVLSELARIRRKGSGADRQRAAARAGGPCGVVEFLADQTLLPPGAGRPEPAPTPAQRAS